jgi:hypothetical protein
MNLLFSAPKGVTTMNNEVNKTAAALLSKKAKKKHLTTIISHELWDKLVEYQTKFNENDNNNVGKVSVNSLIETSVKQFLNRQGETA